MPSTVIRNMHCDAAKRILSVWFVPSGNRYDYEDVAPQTYAAFRKASSKGRFFTSSFETGINITSWRRATLVEHQAERIRLVFIVAGSGYSERPSLPCERMTEVDGLSLHMIEDGPMEATSFLFLHGWPQSCHPFVDERDNLESAGSSVFTPVLYVRGDAERSELQSYLDGFRKAGLTNLRAEVLASCGHFSPDEQPDALGEVLRRFAESDRSAEPD